MKNLNEQDIRKFKQYFKHNNPTEIRVFDKQKYPDGKSYFMKTEEDFLESIKFYQKEEVDCYIGFRDRTDKGDKNVVSSEEIFFEIDEHDIKKPEEKKKVLAFLKENNIEIGMSGFSGGGFHFYIPHTKKLLETEEDREMYKRILTAFKKALQDYGIDVDTKVFNLERVSRVLGTFNFKRNELSKILLYNPMNFRQREENHKAIRKLISKYEEEKVKVDKNAVELLEKYKINETDKWLYDLLKKGIVIKEDTGGNSIVFKNTAIILTRENIPKEERKIIAKAVADLCEGRTLSALDGWIKKCEDNEIYEIYKNELNKFIKDNSYDLTPYELTEKDKEEIREYKEQTQEYKKIKLADLNASLVNRLVEVDCQITGEQTQKAIPEEIEITCETCGKSKIFNSLDNPEPFITDREIKTILQELKNKFACECVFSGREDGEEKMTPYKTIKIKKYVDYSIIYVRDLLDRESLTAVKRYEPKRVYVINQTLPNAKKVNIQGKVFIEPKTKNLSIICNNIKHLENQVEDFKITEQFKENSKKYFNSGENIYKQINPDIVGKAREIAKQSIILQLHSPCKIYDTERIKLIRGGLNVLHFGDTKCAKSDLAKDVTNKGSIPVGEYTICETGGRTGFLYTIDRDRNALIWGSLVLNDMGLVIFEGLQSMHSEELGEFREAIEGQEVNVKRSISGEAIARTRILALFNPNKPMNNYIYKCQGITDSYVFSKTPDITRWDIAIPFCLKDVTSKEIAYRKSGKRPVPQDIFINHIYWVWSRKPEQIIYTDSATKKINDFSEELIETYSLEVLPLVHNGIRDIITRLSVAQACLMHSTDESHEKVIIETEHVVKAISWYKEALEMLELAKYKQDTEGKSELTDNDCIAITKELGQVEWQILEEIKHEGKSSSQLSEILELVPKTIKEHYKPLQKHGLIEASTGKGISLSVRGVKFVRWGMLGAGNIVTNEVTNKIISNEKSSYVTRKKESIEKYCIDKKQDKINFSDLDKEFENG